MFDDRGKRKVGETPPLIASQGSKCAPNLYLRDNIILSKALQYLGTVIKQGSLLEVALQSARVRILPRSGLLIDRIRRLLKHVP